MQAYLTAAAEISRLAVGDPARDGARGDLSPCRAGRRSANRSRARRTARAAALSVVHTFPADGDYRFRVSFYHETTGALYGNGRAALHTADAPEQIEISVDGARVALLDIDRWMNTSDPDGVNLRTEPIAITAGPHRVSAAFIRRFEGPVQDLISPLDWSIASTSIADAYGFTTLPHLRDMAITGPFSDDRRVARRRAAAKIFTCHPATAPQQIGVRARHRLAPRVAGVPPPGHRARCQRVDGALSRRARPRAASKRASGWRSKASWPARASCSASRSARPARAPARPTRSATSTWRRACRSSCGRPGPTRSCCALAEAGRLSTPATLEQPGAADARRSRARTCSASRFAAQWLRLQDLDKINPDVRFYPDFDEQLKTSMRRETELFFRHIVREDRPVLDLFTADYTFVDERLAQHYGIPGVVGSAVPQGDVSRRCDAGGLLGHGSILTLTSHADRTSPVLRGKWVMEVLLGTPPPPPPPNVPGPRSDARGRRRPAAHGARAHGAAPREPGLRVVPPHDRSDRPGARELRRHRRLAHQGQRHAGRRGQHALRRHAADRARRFAAGAAASGRGVLVQTFTENLMTYALGRRLGDDDMPARARHRAAGRAAELHALGVRRRDRQERRRSG